MENTLVWEPPHMLKNLFFFFPPFDLPLHNSLVIFCWGEIPQNTKRNKKRGYSVENGKSQYTNLPWALDEIFS
jgi:hypothetical protein